MLETQLTCVPLSSGVTEMKSGRATSRVQRELWCWAVVYFPKQICPNSNTTQLSSVSRKPFNYVFDHCLVTSCFQTTVPLSLRFWMLLSACLQDILLKLNIFVQCSGSRIAAGVQYSMAPTGACLHTVHINAMPHT